MSVKLAVQQALASPVSLSALEAALSLILAGRNPEDLIPAEGAQLTLRITDDEEIRDLNRRYRGEDQATDVLSFLHADEAAFSLPDEPREWGDLVISRPYVERFAARGGTDTASEFLLCFVHGGLHLVGRDHDTPERADSMFACQDRIARQLGFRPGPTRTPGTGNVP